MGNKVYQFNLGPQNAGNYQVVWKATDYRNKRVSSGFYFYQLITEKFSSSKKMLLLK